MKRFSGLNLIRYARDKKIGKTNKFKNNESTKIERVRNSAAKIQLRSTMPEGVENLDFIKFRNLLTVKKGVFLDILLFAPKSSQTS